jgi:hypothetical protein
MNENFTEGRASRGCIGYHLQYLPGRPISEAAYSDAPNLARRRRLSGRCRTVEMATSGMSSGRQAAPGEFVGSTNFISRRCLG